MHASCVRTLSLTGITIWITIAVCMSTALLSAQPTRQTQARKSVTPTKDSTRTRPTLVSPTDSVQRTPALRVRQADRRDSAQIFRESITSEGREFWLTFQRNFTDEKSKLSLQLFITGNETTQIIIEIEGLGFRREVTVRGGTVMNVVIDTAAQVTDYNRPDKLGVHIVSEKPITVYGLNRRFQSTDTFMGLPVEALGTEYRAVGYEKLSEEFMSQIAVVATEDNTIVTMTPTALTSGGRSRGVPFAITLNRGEVYQIMPNGGTSRADLTGTYIRATKKIAVFSGHSCAYVPLGEQACNHLVEQLPPLDTWGKQFYLGTFATRSRYTLRVVASEPETRIFSNARLVAKLNAGEFYEDSNVRDNLQIAADKPVLVTQYAHGFQRDSIGDPMMILVSPTQQFLRKYRFATPINGSWRHYINVVVLRDAIGTMRLDGKPIDSDAFKPFGTSRYSLAQLQVAYGTHVIEGGAPFGLYSYGFGFGSDGYDAYGNMAGQSFAEIGNIPDTLAPTADRQLLTGGMKVIIRDDRESDKGLLSMRVINNDGFVFTPPSITPGVPQAEFDARPASNESFARALIEITDVAGNSSTYTLCYTPFAATLDFTYSVLIGDDHSCKASSSYFAGMYVSPGSTFHSANFRNAGTAIPTGTYSNGNGTAGIGGLVAGKRFTAGYTLTARLGIEQFGGTLTAPDTVLTPVRDPQGQIVNSQLARRLSLASSFLTAGIYGEFPLSRVLYAVGGLKTAIALGSSVEIRRAVLTPGIGIIQPGTTTLVSEYVESSGSINQLSGFQVGVAGGIGALLPVPLPFVSGVSVFGEMMYTRYFTSLIAEGNWTVQQFTLNIGVRYAW